MTDNEKRAHDLAIATLQMVGAKQDVDVYIDYLNLYKTLLEKFNVDFQQD